MFLDILQFLTTNKLAIVGAAATIGELVVIAVNTMRKCKAQKVQIMSNQQVKTKSFLWSANPINLFRKVD
jgi:hypothetical protein